MKKTIQRALILAIIFSICSVSVISAQYPGYVWGTAYQLVNISDGSASVTVNYYDTNGVEAPSSSRTYSSIGSMESILVVQKKDDPNLNGSYSAIVTASGKMAAIVNQQTYLPGGTNPYPPFSSYAGFEAGSRTVYLPDVMYNYYNFYTEMFIMNTGDVETTVTIAYYPATIFGTVIGKTNVTESVTIPPKASKLVSQQANTNLGTVSCGTSSCFFGSAILSSDKSDVAVAVNQHNPVQKKLFSYNGFSQGSPTIAVPNYMRTYYEYYSAMTVLNTNASNTACVRFTYVPDPVQSKKLNGTPINVATDTVVAEHVISPLNSILLFDGFTATDDQSDLDDTVVYSSFFGTVRIESFAGTVGATTCGSAVNLAAIVNVESDRTKNAQAGAYSGIDPTTATSKLIAPIILADYYGYYTNLTIQNTTANTGTCTFTYTSGPDSAVPANSKSYSHSISSYGQITVYEGRKGTARGDINTDASWVDPIKGNRFIGAAKISCDSGVKVVGFTNEEKDILGIDSMYTFNTLNQ